MVKEIKEVAGEGFDGIHGENINQLVFESHTVELTEEEFKELTGGKDEGDEVVLAPPELTKTLNKWYTI